MQDQKTTLVKPQVSAYLSDTVLAYEAEWWQPDYWLTDFEQCVLVIALAGMSAAIAGAATLGTGAYIAAQAAAAGIAWLSVC